MIGLDDLASFAVPVPLVDLGRPHAQETGHPAHFETGPHGVSPEFTRQECLLQRCELSLLFGLSDLHSRLIHL